MGGGVGVFFFYMTRGGRIQIPLQMDHHRPASETPFKWRADNDSTLKAGSVAS